MLTSVPASLKIYLVTYSFLLVVSITLIIKNRERYEFLTKEYFQFIFTIQRFVIYILGSLALILPVPYLNYHSWDYPIAVFQPIFSYITAPWAIGVFYRMIKGSSSVSEVYVAFCMMLFTGSWSVEIYLLFRDGYYMPDWLPNIFIGIFCYLLVGVIWNIEWKNGNGSFAFIKNNKISG